MKKVIKNYLAKLQENEKKGFSLVELIIVMAIMAILVGIVASQVLPYMEKSRVSKDQQVLSSLCTDITAAIANSGTKCTGTSGKGVEFKDGASLMGATNEKAVIEFAALRSLKKTDGSEADKYDDAKGLVDTYISDLTTKFASKKYGDLKLGLYVDEGTGKIIVFVDSDPTKDGLDQIKDLDAKQKAENET